MLSPPSTCVATTSPTCLPPAYARLGHIPVGDPLSSPLCLLALTSFVQSRQEFRRPGPRHPPNPPPSSCVCAPLYPNCACSFALSPTFCFLKSCPFDLVCVPFIFLLLIFLGFFPRKQKNSSIDAHVSHTYAFGPQASRMLPGELSSLLVPHSHGPRTPSPHCKILTPTTASSATPGRQHRLFNEVPVVVSA